MVKSHDTNNLSSLSPEAEAFGNFYKTKRGEDLNNEIIKSLAVGWPKKTVSRCHILTIGYPLPGLKKLFKKALSFAVFFPAFMGPNEVKWRGRNVSAVVNETRLPLRQGSYDAAFVFHSLEFMTDPVSFLEDLWRTLAPAGRVTVLVPNRRAGWKKSGVPGQEEANPFLFREVKTLLEGAGFKPINSYGVFYGLPVGFLQTILFSGLLKTLSGGSFAGLPGFMIVEAEKNTGPQKIKFTDPLKRAPGVKASPGFIPE